MHVGYQLKSAKIGALLLHDPAQSAAAQHIMRNHGLSEIARL
jgi:hypothetical protein